MFFYLINIFNYSDIGCINRDTTINYIIDNSNYTDNLDIIDKYCSVIGDKCMIYNNSSYFVSCNYKSVVLESGDENCVLFVLLTILINLLLFFIYKGFLEEFVDHLFLYLWHRITSLCVTVDKPTYRYISYNTL